LADEIVRLREDPMNVTLYIWRVPVRRLPAVAWRLATDRGRLRRTPGVVFAKLLGTGRDRRFGPGSADLTRWAALVIVRAGVDVPTLRRWRAMASAECQLELRTITSRGRWSGREPFEPSGDQGEGMALALTRARLRPTRAIRFWRAIKPPAQAADRAPGLLAAFGFGEAPIGWQGTMTLWRGSADLVEFAYRHPDHRRVIERAPTERWYAEELFARFAVVRVTGDPGVIGWTHTESVERRTA
jgi:hypothetical protein